MNRLSKPVGLVMKKAVTDGKAKTAVEWAEYYGGQSPGPGEYDVVRKPNWKPEAAGKFGRGKLPISDIDRRVKDYERERTDAAATDTAWRHAASQRVSLKSFMVTKC